MIPRIFALSCFACAVFSCGALQCYICHSLTNSDCKDPFLPQALPLETCYSNVTPNPECDCGTEQFVCKKSFEWKADNRSYYHVIRSCSRRKDFSNNDDCNETSTGRVCHCSTDGCNQGASLYSAQTTNFTFVVLFISLLFLTNFATVL